jgi:hypothetical protein
MRLACPCRRGVPVTPTEVERVVQRCAADVRRGTLVVPAEEGMDYPMLRDGRDKRVPPKGVPFLL